MVANYIYREGNMRRFSAIFLLVMLFSMIAGATSVQAQTYLFKVPREIVSVYVKDDGTLSIDYSITFTNESSDPLDIVDIGMPNYDYEMNSITADVDGNKINDIRVSEYVSPGIEVHLGKYTIQPGNTATLHVNVGNVRNALGKSTLEESQDYASLVFTPNYYGREYVRGNTHLTFSIILPAGMDSQEPRYHTPSNNWPGVDEPTASFDSQSRVVYTWDSTDANASTVYSFGASVPMRLVPAEVVVATETPNRRTIDLESVLPCLCFSGVLASIVGIGILGAVSANKRKLQYLPPKISIEGHGIKRGLTAVEAAILMEQPLDKVMTMILFSSLKKGAATVITRDPLKLEVTEPLPAGLQPYEETFLKAFAKENTRERRTELQNVTVGLVKSVSEKMKGFSRKETITYYENIMAQAWQQVVSAKTPEVKSEAYEQVMDWTMLDKDWEGRTRETFGPQPIFVPIWWWRYDPVIRSTGWGSAAKNAAPQAVPSMPSAGKSISVPKLPGSDFAASVVGGVQNFSAGVIGDIKSFTSNVTNRTNPVPVSRSTGSHSRGGGGGCVSCACACACAGCACACAGGGR
jgi:hypothetical protein